MDSDSEDPLPNLFRQMLLVLFSLLDDVLIVGLSRLGCHLPWLQWLSPVVITCTVLYLVVQFCRSSYGQKVFQLCQEWMQGLKPEPVET
jgi:hypothetical protein